MEGKTVIMTVLLLSLVLGQIRVEALVCCPSDNDRKVYSICVFFGRLRLFINQWMQKHPWDHDILENTGDNAFNEYCKLGCSSFVCGAIVTLQNSDACEVVNGTVEKCTKACSAFCTKGSITAA